MKTKKIIILALALSLPVGSLLAQNDGPPPDGSTNGPGGGRRPHPPMPIITALDVNHDGVISADEIANAPAALKTLDKNGDGQLTRDEYMPPHPPGGPGGPDGPGARDGAGGPPDGPPPGDGAKPDQDKHRRPVPPIISALDTNGDGIISADEIANASASLLKLDKNSDGQLTMDELRPPRPPQDGNDQDGPRGGGRRPPRGGDDKDGQRPPPPGQDNN